MQFPRLVYKSASTHILVASDAEYAAALEAGWHGSVPEALGQVNKAAPVVSAVEDLGAVQPAVVQPAAEPSVVAPVVPVEPIPPVVAAPAAKPKKELKVPSAAKSNGAAQATKTPWD